jgi:hypothetical protein
MNCDQVFDILTRGPFPTGTSCDSGVEAHLAQCESCHQLAEALRPALELFQEAVDPEESRDLPGYWCALVADRKQPVVSYAQELELPRTSPRTWEKPAAVPALSALAVWRLAAMLALGVTLGSLVGSRWNQQPFAPPPREPMVLTVAPADEEPRPSAAARSEWAVLPAACLGNIPGIGPRHRERQDRLLATADLSNVHCCSGCHNATADKVPGAATAKVARHCQECHTTPRGR